MVGERKMKICQLCAVDFTMRKFLLPLIDGQVANGDTVIGVCSDGEYVQGMRDEGYHIHTIPISRSMHPIKHICSIWKLYRYFRKEKFDVVHVHTPVAALVGRTAAFFARVPFVVYTAHGFYFHDDMKQTKRRFHIFLEKFAGKITDLMFTQSEEDARTAVEKKIMPAERVFPIGNGVDVNIFDPAKFTNKPNLRTTLAIPTDAYVIGMIGRQVEEKGIVEFIDSAILIAEKHENVYFLLVGNRLESDHAVAVDHAIEEAKRVIGSRLILTGMRSDIPELLSVMDLFTLPSWREGMPRTIIEAMMMGLPVIATNIRGSREEVLEEETGLLVPVRNPEKLAEALLRLIEKPDWGRTLGIAGRKRALELYDEQKVVALQIKLIQEHM
jgi:glycosyltransferase involved in cell wall biosynthesis